MPLNNFGLVENHLGFKNGRLFRAAQPHAAGLKTARAMGIISTYRLSHSSEGGMSLKDERLSFGDTVIHDEFPEILRFHEMEHVLNAVEALQRELKKGDVLVHCSHGRDRTGLVIGAWQLLHGGMGIAAVERNREAYGVHGLIYLADLPDKKILDEIASM